MGFNVNFTGAALVANEVTGAAQLLVEGATGGDGATTDVRAIQVVLLHDGELLAEKVENFNRLTWSTTFEEAAPPEGTQISVVGVAAVPDRDPLVWEAILDVK